LASKQPVSLIGSIGQEVNMDDIMREKLLKIALVAIGAIFFTIYPLSLIWPSGWQWHSGHGQYYFQMICGIYVVLGAYLIAAARNPSENRSLISFTIWSSIVHAGIMALQATLDGHETGHLVGDVPALLLVAAVLWYLAPDRQERVESVALSRH
jgi:Family of unknown function (DUF6632)